MGIDKKGVSPIPHPKNWLFIVLKVASNCQKIFAISFTLSASKAQM